jgi:peptidoglycan hydrolase-like protein with peptidoglycan-binding domain
MSPIIFGIAALGIAAAAKFASAASSELGEKKLPEALAKQLADSVVALGFADGEHLTGTPTVKAVQTATTLASTLADMGYPKHAAYLRGYVEAASKKLPTPATPKGVVIPDMLTPAESDKISRILSLERDPVKLRDAARWLRQRSTSGQAQSMANLLEQMATKIESDKLSAKTQIAVDEVMKGNPEPKFSTTSTTVPKAVAPAAKPVTPPVMPTDVPLGGNTATPSWAEVAALKSKPTLRKGSRGEPVKVWQRVVAVKDDGNFGSGTHTATVAWQARNGLTADGVVGPKTWAKASEPSGSLPVVPGLDVPGIANMAASAISATANAYGLPDPLANMPAIATALAPASAVAVATHLRALQAANGMPKAKGKEDKTLVKRFQADNGLTQDGKMGPGSTALLAKLGVGDLPLVMYWPKASGQKGLAKYKDTLTKLASDAELAGNSTLAEAIRTSSGREKGQGGL